MIPLDEIRAQARLSGVPLTSVERDYAQSWLLSSLSERFEVALKGGTGVRKVHLEGYRFSDDLDFTLLKDYDVGTIGEGVREAVEVARSWSGIRFMDDVTVKEVDNGFTASVYFRIIRSTGNPLRIKLDLTRVGNEGYPAAACE